MYIFISFNFIFLLNTLLTSTAHVTSRTNVLAPPAGCSTVEAPCAVVFGTIATKRNISRPLAQSVIRR